MPSTIAPICKELCLFEAEGLDVALRHFCGLTVMGDMIVTCAEHSRSKQCGYCKGVEVTEAQQKVGMVGEGVNVLSMQ